MLFEWDPAKDERNRQQRGFGFDIAALIFEGDTLEWPGDRRDYGESRVRTVGEAQGLVLHVVFHGPWECAPDDLGSDGGQEGAGAMARKSMTLEAIKASRPRVDRAKVAATTDDDIRRHQMEDGENPDAPLPPFRSVPGARGTAEAGTGAHSHSLPPVGGATRPSVPRGAGEGSVGAAAAPRRRR